MTNDAGSSSSGYLTQRDPGEYLSAIDRHQWNDSDEYVTLIDDRLSKQPSGSTVTDCYAADVPRQVSLTESNHSHKLNEVNKPTDTARTGDSRSSSAMKLKSDFEPSQRQQQHPQSSPQQSEHNDPLSHNSLSPHSQLQSPAIPTVPGISALGGKSPSRDGESPGNTEERPRSSSWRRRTLSNDEPLGAEFDVKQITVRRPVNATSPSDTAGAEFDFFADMAPVITSSAQSLLGILSAAAAAADSSSALQPESRLNMDQLDSTVSCLFVMWNESVSKIKSAVCHAISKLR